MTPPSPKPRHSTLASLVAWLRSLSPARAGRSAPASYANPFGVRAYKIYVPARDSGRARPLVVMLHGCDQTADDFAAATRMNELADELGFIVAYPEQALSANVSRCWNWFKASNQERDVGEPSLIAGITRDVIARRQVDPSRVYIAGMSAGGAMAAIMGHTYPDLYAAVGIHSGLPYAAARDALSAIKAMRGLRATMDPRYRAALFRAVPTIVFHGDLDTTVHARNSAQVIVQATPPHDPAVPPLAPETVEKGEANGRRYTRTTQADASGKTALEHWLVHGSGHAWSGGSPKGSFADPRGPDASRAMLDFFLRLSLAARPTALA
jgi:poly(hydroxyalkanoate) depolymerase family esterase